MTNQNTYATQTRSCIERARDRARADVIDAVIPGFAERFPDQVEHAVETVAAYRLRERGCSVGEPALA